jgi:hypothetical protein
MRWTWEEKCRLKKLFGTMPMNELLEHFPGKTEKSIYNQVYYLRKRKWTFG